MLDKLIQVLIGLLVLAVIWWAIATVATALGLPAMVITIAQVIVVLIAVAWLLRLFNIYTF